MPAHRKSLQELELSGATKKNPSRYVTRRNAPSTGDLGKPHRSLNKEETRIWHEIAKSSPAGILQARDRLSVELACRLLAKARSGMAKAAEFSILTSLLAKLGLNPVDGQRIDAPPPPREDDELDEWFSERPR
ncbi:MAG: terminase small subunit [Edaphobacter sp.]|nr:terminase small subunit [Edaphobacter sp.]